MAHLTDPTQPAPAISAFQAMSDQDVLARYRVGVERLDRRVFELSDAQLDTAFRPEAGVGRWPARVLLGHVADAEMVFVHRIRRAVGEDGPVFALWDENAFIDRGLYGTPETGSKHPVGAYVATVHTLRLWTGPWLATLPASDWARQGMHPERGPMSVRTILNYATWHLEHHAWYLNAKVRRLLGETSAG